MALKWQVRERRATAREKAGLISDDSRCQQRIRTMAIAGPLPVRHDLLSSEPPVDLLPAPPLARNLILFKRF